MNVFDMRRSFATIKPDAPLHQTESRIPESSQPEFRNTLKTDIQRKVRHVQRCLPG
jgi:hypothetical protein